MKAKDNISKGNIGIIGMGRIGLPTAKAFISMGYSVYGSEKEKEGLVEFYEMNGIPCATPAEVAFHCEVVIVLVLNDVQVDEVINGNSGLLNGLKPGSIIICMSTVNRSFLERIADRCNRKQIGFIDCPFTGGSARVASGNLTLIVAAPDELIERVFPLLNVIGKVMHVGQSPGLGQAVKHCNQLIVATMHAATMELFTLAKIQKLDLEMVCEVVGSGIAGSEYFRLLSGSVLSGLPSPGGLGQMCKDTLIVSNTLDEMNMEAGVARAAFRYFRLAEEQGMQDQEGSALLRIVEQQS
ncbi:NAD(P)-dependent oxidoreductase [Algoriphagus sp.]|uniref:NAD(P)-dependent oxidoreductase n=1 Tax=Algoriphagus sp. TaxID=1872435 RepID=UPI003F72BD05